MSDVLTPGVCRVCGCTAETPCMEGGLPCAWMDLEHTLCDNLQCIAVIPLRILEQMCAEREAAEAAV